MYGAQSGQCIIRETNVKCIDIEMSAVMTTYYNVHSLTQDNDNVRIQKIFSF